MTALRETLGRKRLAIAAVLAVLSGAAAPAETPLFQEGKSQLFQRVLLRSDQPARASPGAPGSGVAARALAPVFVFERAENNGLPWLRVATTETGDDSFWMPESQATQWRQTIVLKFTTLGDFDRLLIFDTIDAVYDVIESEDPAYDAEQLRRDAEASLQAGRPNDRNVLALGPELGVDLSTNFYMLPILDAEEAIFETGGFVNLVKIAVAKARSDGSTDPKPRPNREEVLADFSAGVVFAVDTTRSMGKYFEAVRTAVADIYARLGQAGAAHRVFFGLVGFRDEKVNAEVEYRVRTFAPLTPATDPTRFLDGLDRMREARGSTKGFNEDSFAGVKHSLDEMAWGDIDARFVVLITDAGPRLNDDPMSATRLSARGLANYAKEIHGVHLVTLHLKTPRGARTHAFAEAQYTELSRIGSADPLYFEVPQGDERALSQITRRLSDALVNAVVSASEGSEIDPDAYVPDPEATADEAELARRALRVAKSMQLDYLGAETAARAPDVFEGWIADRDFRNQGVRPVEIRLLVNRRQLSDLDEALRVIIEKGEESGLDPTNFFRRVLSAAAEMSRRPDQVAGAGAGDSLADAALISEMLEGLPYRSQIMSVSETDWLKKSIAEQQEFLDLLYEKLERYRQAASGVDNWILLHPDHSNDEAVYPMPLEDLP